jgi:prevent-host-death family protein
MASWGIAELKAKASEIVEGAQTQGPQHITRHGKRVALIVSPEEWEKRNRPHGQNARTMSEFSRIRHWWVPALTCAGHGRRRAMCKMTIMVI